MQTRRIGSLEVSVVGLGCNNFGWRIDAEASAKVIDAAIESGITFFDTADRYGKGQSEDFSDAPWGRDEIKSFWRRSSEWKWRRDSRVHHRSIFWKRLKRACAG
jgi:predicted aldo/keto reductase-like oxidoreductase